MNPQPLPTMPSHTQAHPNAGDEGGPGGLAATALAILLVFVFLLIIGKPWKRSKLPRATAKIHDNQDP